ncbi:glycosyltransferase family 2 protein [Burkholderia pseudomultivorans]|uniref:glycosyltransferase family 2 protein n=1 Tax=Burkholderia pseudomultivorans TaxID=1207504 RepID=UPI00189009D4|nr:glycosyltransferase [Burkholderia pseudomultivorans]MBF5010950.1 glycosyltransferase [Burkholderia pseudomultivorans]
MNKFVLQKLMVPDVAVCDIASMFYRAPARYSVEEKAIIVDSPMHLDFHTYFNLFPLRHFQDFMDIRNISLEAVFEGRAEFLLYFVQVGAAEPVLKMTTIVESSGASSVNLFGDIDISSCDGYAYLVLNTHSEVFKLRSVDVCCLSEREVAKVGIVSCTFRRERDVKATAKSLTRAFDEHPEAFSGTELFVIDNDGGKTLVLDPHPKLVHIKNSNLGGAGGFTRGMIASLDSEKTHVLLCDDDILVFGEVVRRAVVALSLLKDPNMGLHGAMLELEFKSVLHEVGEYFDIDKKLHVNMHYGKKMDELGDLKSAQFESLGNSRASNMFGWWFTAFPMSIVKKIGLPLPLFVSGDDVEYGLRAYAAGYRALIAPYISIWHPSHMTQQAPLRSYFITRNRLGYAPNHTSRKRLAQLFAHASREAMHMALTKRYATADSMCAAMEDFLRGTTWLNEGLDDWLKALRWPAREKTARLYANDWMTPIDPVGDTRPEGVWKTFVRKVTFNGHLFSSAFHSPAQHPASSFHKCIPHGVSPIGKRIERIAMNASSILYYDPRGQVGYRVFHNNSMFWRVYWRLTKIRLRARFGGIGGLHRTYSATFPVVTTEAWWRKRLGL